MTMSLAVAPLGRLNTMYNMIHSIFLGYPKPLGLILYKLLGDLHIHVVYN